MINGTRPAPLDPHGLLASVDPALAQVIRAAAQSPVRFQVIQGLRTGAQEAAEVAAGKSTTLHSRHLGRACNGLAAAVDVCALTDQGSADWTPARYGQIAAQIRLAADALNVPIEWGGDWKSFRDLDHFQLPWAEYP